MISDFHVHTRLSADSHAPIDAVIKKAISLGMSHLCITDHHDIDYDSGEEGLDFKLDGASYYPLLMEYKKKYEKEICLLIGVELGLQPHIKQELEAFLSMAPYDFVIGSSHVINGIDPYYDTLWKKYTREEVMRMYFENIYENIQIHDNFDVYGHLDYAIRYAKEKDIGYEYEQYQELIDAILKKIIAMGKGIEINTSSLTKGLRSTNPCEGIIKRYRALGGELITVGSDAHIPDMVGTHFSEAKEILLRCGFDGYYIFKERKPLYQKLKEGA